MGQGLEASFLGSSRLAQKMMKRPAGAGLCARHPRSEDTERRDALRYFEPVHFSRRLLMIHDLDLIVFDLDGTLVDSVPDLAAAANHALRRLGLPEHSAEEHKRMVGAGEKNFVRRFLGPDHQDLYHQALALYLEYYAQHLGDQTRLYPGVTETLTRLASVKKAVLSNKREDLAQEVVKVMGLAGFFQAVRGGNSYGVLKPGADGLRALIRELGSAPGRTFMVGDKPEDILAGRGAGAGTVALTCGYADLEALAAAKPDFLLDSFSQLTDLFGV